MSTPLALKITDLKKQYQNGKVALKGINLEVKEGDFFALLGPNGAGKSTTIGIITDLVQPSSGHVEVFGVDTQKNRNLAKSMIGLVPQEFNFNPFEPCEEIVINQAGYLGIPRSEARKRTAELLRLLDLTDKAKVMARELSGGMKRRLMIARALVHNPRLLILDEPTAGVDIEIRRQTWELMKRVNAAGTTIILTTHYLEEAEQMCKNIAIINHGEIVQQSSMSALLRELQSESFILDLSAPATELPQIPGIELKLIDPMTLEAEITKPHTINDLFMGLNTKNIKIDTMRNKANRLEELFLRITNEPQTTGAKDE
ncbi:ABC transporter ATP-binding protein [Ignatzschineria indica]|uniref:ABC transporter n=1 Tax=Ignatzschineria indica TaxID=472583 RepID=A0A2U2AK70_9GAMM|nr:ABC transporter ATP-binding protein [Ignatzschineria indica]PWD83180.1 ABC transporter [Ignatzschineria indica]GGZ82276.1 ABC transporter ATP-binding protein [Ignatzschineria indica]